jgi:hypothetical protein
MASGAGANQVTSATILNIANIRIKNNMTVVVSDLPSRHNLHGQIRKKRNIRDIKRVRGKSALSSNRKRGFIGDMNNAMTVRQMQRRNMSRMMSHVKGNNRIKISRIST